MEKKVTPSYDACIKAYNIILPTIIEIAKEKGLTETGIRNLKVSLGRSPSVGAGGNKNLIKSETFNESNLPS